MPEIRLNYATKITIDEHSTATEEMHITRSMESPIENESTSNIPVALEDKIKVYTFLFGGFTSINDIISKYVDIANPKVVLDRTEIQILRQYIRYYSQLEKKIWTQETIVKFIKIEMAMNKITDKQLLINTSLNTAFEDTDFASYEIQDEKKSASYSAISIQKKQSTVFDEMRKIDVEKKFYDSDSVDVFIKQAKFMKKFSDDYTGYADFYMHHPSYNGMDDNQLHTYFTWRTKTRNKEIAKTSSTYVFLYIYELINNIGVKNPTEGIESLVWILKKYWYMFNVVEQYLIDWIKDYYVCNQFDISFRDLVEKYQLEAFYPAIMATSDTKEYSFEILCSMSNYKIKDSKFFTEERQVYIIHCLKSVLSNLTHFFSLYGTDFNKMVTTTTKDLAWWEPFKGALYKKPTSVGNTMDKTVILSSNENYILKSGIWKYYVAMSYSTDGFLILSYIIKKVEAILRKLANHKAKLKVDTDRFKHTIEHSYDISTNIKTLVSDPLFDEIIEEITTFEFSKFAMGCDTVALPPISKKLNYDPKEEPYALFIKMRLLEKLPGTENRAKNFYAQACILKDMTDDFEYEAPFENYAKLCYDEMTNDQLRTYFTWRSKVMQGEFSETYFPYIRLYLFELITNVDKFENEKVFEKLSVILKQYARLSEWIEGMIADFIKDYYLCSNFEVSFYDLLKKFDILAYYPCIAIDCSTDFDFELYHAISNYEITKSIFYTDETAPIIADCCKHVFTDLNVYFSKNKFALKKKFLQKRFRGNYWKPFIHVPFEISPDADKKVTLCSTEVYSYKKGRWICHSASEMTTSGPVFLGYVFKRIEVKMRELYQFKYKLTAKVTNSVLKKASNTILQNPAFTQTIDDAVIKYFKQNHPRIFSNPDTAFEKPIEVKIDMSKLGKIREDANIIKEKLTLEDDVGANANTSEQNPVIAIKDAKTEVKKTFNSPTQEFCHSLTEIQRQAVIILVSGAVNASILATFAEKNKIMLEVLLEGINELALDSIGDNIIETADANPFIYDDYFEELKLELGEK